MQQSIVINNHIISYFIPINKGLEKSINVGTKPNKEILSSAIDNMLSHLLETIVVILVS